MLDHMVMIMFINIIPAGVAFREPFLVAVLGSLNLWAPDSLKNSRLEVGQIFWAPGWQASILSIVWLIHCIVHFLCGMVDDLFSSVLYKIHMHLTATVIFVWRSNRDNQMILGHEQMLQKSQAEQIQKIANSESPQSSQQDSVPNMIPWKHLSVGERKRLQWARERGGCKQ